MSAHDDATGRLPLLEPKSLNREQQNLYQRIESSMLPWAKKSGFKAVTGDGQLLGPFNALLYNPEMGAAMLNYLATERDATGLDAAVREVVILTVGAGFESAYELYAHRAVAAQCGLAQADIEALAHGEEPKTLTPDQLTAHHFVRALVREHRASPELWKQAFDAFGNRCLVDMVHLAGLYLTTSVLLNAFAVPIPKDDATA